MCVCLYVYECVCMCVLVYECVHVCERKSVQVQVHICSKRMRASEERGRKQEHICACTHLLMYAISRVYARTLVRVCMYCVYDEFVHGCVLPFPTCV